MDKNRLEAFSDGVIAIIITIMVLELKVPHTDSLDAIKNLWPIFLSYVLSFVYIGSYWNNHHNLIKTAKSINGSILWINLHLLFWLSLLPFTTGWMGENHFSKIPTVLYGFNLLMCAISYYILQYKIAKHHNILELLGSDFKGKISLVLYIVGIGSALYIDSIVAFGIFSFILLIWFIPDQRMETIATEQDGKIS